MLAAIMVVLAMAGPAAGANDPSAARKGAQARANAAAARLAAAQSALARAQGEVVDVQARQRVGAAKLDALLTHVRTVAVSQYVRGAVQPLVFDGNLSQAGRQQVFARVVTLGDTDSIDALRAAQQDYDASAADLRASLKTRRAAAAQVRDQVKAAEGELNKLVVAEKVFQAKEAAARAAAAARTGGKAASRGTAPVTGVSGVIASGEWICPVQGPHSFSNDFGDPRPGGRRHQGNDLLSPRGTPIVANVGGTVVQHSSGLGGTSYYLHGNDGNTYYGAHLSGYAASGAVSAGTVIGYVGNTGDAAGGPPHLHFEIHPGGGGAVNPYPTLVKYC